MKMEFDPRIFEYIYRGPKDLWGDPKIREDAPDEIKEAFERDLKTMKRLYGIPPSEW